MRNFFIGLALVVVLTFAVWTQADSFPLCSGSGMAVATRSCTCVGIETRTTLRTLQNDISKLVSGNAVAEEEFKSYCIGVVKSRTCTPNGFFPNSCDSQ